MKPTRTSLWLVAVVALITFAPSGARRSSAGETGVYTAAQAAAGQAEYGQNCSRCHGDKMQGISAPALRGAGSGLAGDDVGTAYRFISTQMPAGNPGSLSAKQYGDILAFILKQNGHPAGTRPLTAATAKTEKTTI